MIKYVKTLLAKRANRRAVVALEYGLMAGLLAVVVFTASSTLGSSLDSAFNDIANLL
jgi:pilus assembly protein Flp/PilA